MKKARSAGLDGAEGGRTPDLLNAIQALSQLSYGPVGVEGSIRGILASVNAESGEATLLVFNLDGCRGRPKAMSLSNGAVSATCRFQFEIGMSADLCASLVFLMRVPWAAA